LIVPGFAGIEDPPSQQAAMRGFPPIQIFLIALAFGVLAFPLARLTGGGEVVMSANLESAAAAETPAYVRVRFAHPPQSVRLMQSGRDLLAGVDLSASPAETEAGIRISPDGDELQLDAEWPEGTPDTALTIEIEPDGRETREQTRWSTGSTLSELLLFQW